MVLSRAEVDAVFAQFHGMPRLVSDLGLGLCLRRGRLPLLDRDRCLATRSPHLIRLGVDYDNPARVSTQKEDRIARDGNIIVSLAG